jgi:hypothetical protein
MTVSRDLNMTKQLWYPKTWLWRVVLRSACTSSRLDEHICEAPFYLGGVVIHNVKEIEKNDGWCIIMLASLA